MMNRQKREALIGAVIVVFVLGAGVFLLTRESQNQPLEQEEERTLETA